MKYYKTLLITVLILLLLNGIIYYNQYQTNQKNDKLLKQYNVTLSKGEQLITCYDKYKIYYQKVTNQTIKLCNKTINPNYKGFKQKGNNYKYSIIDNNYNEKTKNIQSNKYIISNDILRNNWKYRN